MPFYIVFCVYIFLVGACIGSFLDLCACRIPSGQPVVFGRSRCPACGHSLSALDLVPVLSCLFLRGRCRYCGGNIPLRSTVTELISGALFMCSFFSFGLTPAALVTAIFLSLLLLGALIDLDTGEIPDRISVIIALLSIFPVFFFKGGIASHLLGAAALSLPLLILALFGGFGGGDIKLAAACGLFLGLKLTLIGGFIAIVSGGMAGLVLLAFFKAKRGATMAFGPFIALGMTASALFGDRLLALYLSLF